MIFEIKGLLVGPHYNLKQTIMRTFAIEAKDIAFAEHRDNSVLLRCGSKNAQDKVMAFNGRRVALSHSALSIRKNADSFLARCSARPKANNALTMKSMKIPSHSISDTMFKAIQIPSKFNVNDVVKYFAVSCKAPLRTCYQLDIDQDMDSDSG